jgi:hypothetical protein
MQSNGGGIVELFAGLVGLAFAALWLLIAYGAIILIFRHAFGIELPNPFEFLPAEWREKFPFLVQHSKIAHHRSGLVL